MLILVRHGRTAANAGGQMQGRVDNPLDEVGIEQAEAIAAALESVDRVVTTPEVDRVFTTPKVDRVVTTPNLRIQTFASLVP